MFVKLVDLVEMHKTDCFEGQDLSRTLLAQRQLESLCYGSKWHSNSMFAAENANNSGECAAQQTSLNILATKLHKSVAGLALPAAMLITACCPLLRS